MNILIVDDHTIFCEGLKRVLDTHKEISVVAVARNGLEAINLAGRYLPDVILMDVEMPKMGGIEATCAIKKCYPQIKILMLTMHVEKRFVLESRRAGACGYILKDADVEELLEAINNLCEAGEGEWDNKNYAIFKKNSDGYNENLTEREKEIIKLLAAGLTNKEIARQLSVSIHTVKNHLTNIYNKLNCINRAGALRLFHGNGA